jgi:hypothetical protein
MRHLERLIVHGELVAAKMGGPAAMAETAPPASLAGAVESCLFKPAIRPA